MCPIPLPTTSTSFNVYTTLKLNSFSLFYGRASGRRGFSEVVMRLFTELSARYTVGSRKIETAGLLSRSTIVVGSGVWYATSDEVDEF